MSKPEIEKLLQAEAEKWAAKSYSEIHSRQVNDVERYEVQLDDRTYDFEVRWIDVCDDSVRIYIEISGPGLEWSITFPSRDILLYADGRVKIF